MEQVIHERDEKGRPVASDGLPLAGLGTVAEVAAVLAVSRGKLYQMLTTGELDGVRFGRSLRVRWSDLREKGLI